MGDVDLVLEPGSYALLFGSGRFGATGEGFIRDNHVPNGDWSTYTLLQPAGTQVFQSGKNRFFALAESAPDTVQVRPTFDLSAKVASNSFGDIGAVQLIDGDSSVFVDTDTVGTEPDQAGVLEFSLADVPAGRQISRVTLELNLNLLTHSSGLRLNVEGYAGDGFPQRSDAVGPKTVVGMTNFTSTAGLQTVDISPTFVQSLLQQASHVGLTIRPSDSGNFRFGTLEGGEFLEPPLLTITLAPPPVIPGDFTADGVVDAADYSVSRDHLGAATEAAPQRRWERIRRCRYSGLHALEEQLRSEFRCRHCQSKFVGRSRTVVIAGEFPLGILSLLCVSTMAPH